MLNISPYMTYFIEVWGCASQTQLNCLFLLQKKIITMSFSHYLAHTSPLFLSMENMFYTVGLIMYKYFNNLLLERIPIECYLLTK